MRNRRKIIRKISKFYKPRQWKFLIKGREIGMEGQPGIISKENSYS